MTTRVPWTSEIVGQVGAYNLLESVDSYHAGLPYNEMLRLADSYGSRDPNSLVSSLLDEGVLRTSDDNVLISTLGLRVLCLLNMLNRRDPLGALQRLRQIDPIYSQYDIVMQGMCHEFIATLRDRPSFRHVLICSPWISLTRRMKINLLMALQEVAKAGEIAEIVVIARFEKDREKKRWHWESLEWLSDHGAEVVLHPSIHTKLYIRDPGPAGGLLMAIIGSENLTGARNLELGLRINDDATLIGNLTNYFYAVYGDCTPIEAIGGD